MVSKMNRLIKRNRQNELRQNTIAKNEYLLKIIRIHHMEIMPKN